MKNLTAGARYLLQVIIALCFAYVMIGCASTPEVITRVETKIVAVTPDDDMIVKCDVTPPVSIASYLTAPDSESREKLLVKAYNDVLKDVIVCNVRLEKLQKWKAEQVKLYQN